MDIKRFFAAVFCFLISLPAVPAAAGLSEMAEDQIEVFVRLRASRHSETRFKAGNPPQTVKNSSEVSFTREGEWVFYLIKEEFGGGYFALPAGGEFWPITDIRVSERHACLNDEGMVIGENSHHSSGSGNPALGSVSLHMGEDGKLRLRLAPARIDTTIAGCETRHCIGNFGGGFNVGENHQPGASAYGHDIAVVFWDSLKKQREWPVEYDDGLPPLVPIPFSYTDVQRSGSSDESRIVTYSVITWIEASRGDRNGAPGSAPEIGEPLISHEKTIGIPVYPGLVCAGFIPPGAVPAGQGTSLPVISGFTCDPVDDVVRFFAEKLRGWHFHDGHVRCFTRSGGFDASKPEAAARVHVRINPPVMEGQPVVVQYFYE